MINWTLFVMLVVLFCSLIYFPSDNRAVPKICVMISHLKRLLLHCVTTSFTYNLNRLAVIYQNVWVIYCLPCFLTNASTLKRVFPEK